LDMLAWRSGRLPLSVQQALHHEVHRRGLRQLDIADLIGVSRSHLANLQRGHSGASRKTAAHIREFPDSRS
jgi:transcriptional regulator with XRE-family HTH domain